MDAINGFQAMNGLRIAWDFLLVSERKYSEEKVGFFLFLFSAVVEFFVGLRMRCTDWGRRGLR